MIQAPLAAFALPLTDPAPVFLVIAAVILFAPIAAERAGVPGIIGLIVAGAVVGPNVSGILQRDGAIALLGGVGLLYLMFLGGLDLDREGFEARRGDSLLFGGLTFALPLTLVTGVCLALGFHPLAAVIVASAFTSHTPVTYPIVQRLGLTKNPAVTATLGATLIAVIGALLVLAIVAAVHQGEAGPVLWLRLVASLAAFLAFTLLALPRIVRWFFTGLGQDRAVRYAFVLVVAFGVSALAGAAGIEPIVGAFLAGFALNRFVRDGSILMDRIQFLGSSLLVPLFLISTGMLIDPTVLVGDAEVLLSGLALTAGTVLAKAAAAGIVAVLRGFDRAELGVMFSLSTGQAAGALAAVTVAADIGLIGQGTVNAAILVMVATTLVAAAVGGRAAPRVRQAARRDRRIGEAIVVPIANPESAAALVRVAALVAAPDGGEVIPVNVLGFDAPSEVVEAHRAVAVEAEKVALANGADARSLVRVDSSPSAGVLHTVVESGGTSTLIGWKGYANARENFFGGVIDAILSRSPVPVMVCRPAEDGGPGRVVLSVSRGDLTPTGLGGLDLAAMVAARIAGQSETPLLVIAEQDDRHLRALAGTLRDAEVCIDERKSTIAVRERTGTGDIVVVATPPTRPGLGQDAPRLARALPDRTLLVVLPRQAP